MRFNSGLFGKDPVYASQWTRGLAIMFRARLDLEAAISISTARLYGPNASPLVMERYAVIAAVTARVGPGLAIHYGTERKSGRIRWEHTDVASGETAVDQGRRYGLIVLPEWPPFR
jgi:hypothetical protein